MSVSDNDEFPGSAGSEQVFETSSGHASSSLNASQVNIGTSNSSVHGVEVSSKLESFTDGALKVETFLDEWKILPLVTHITSFIAEKSKKRRAAILWSMFCLYKTRPLHQQVAGLGNHYRDIEAFFRFFLKAAPVAADADSSELNTAMQNAAYLSEALMHCPQTIAGIKIDPLQHNAADIRSQAVATGDKSAIDWIDANIDMIRIGLGVLVLFSTMFGISKLFSLDFFSEQTGEIVRLAATINATKTIKNACADTIDTVLKFVYNWCGREYISPQMKPLKHLSDRINALHEQCVSFANACKIDFMGLMRSCTITELTTKYKELMKIHEGISLEDRRLYNFHDKLAQIWDIISTVNERIVNIIKSSAGKQRPAQLWIAGRPGIGKTVLMGRLARRLNKEQKCKAYFRNVNDEYWSGYSGQAVFIMDDIGQKNDGKDYGDFHGFTSEDYRDTVGAAIPEKGIPFTSRYFFTSSNKIWITQPCCMNDMEAMNRRRDLVVFCHFPELVDYKRHNLSTEPPPEWFEENKAKYYLVDPLWGSTLEKFKGVQAAMFEPKAEWVFGEISEDDIYEHIVELEKMRAEDFRKRLIEVFSDESQFPLPQEPFEFDRSKLLYHQARFQPKPRPTKARKTKKPKVASSSSSGDEEMKILDSGVPLLPRKIDDVIYHMCCVTALHAAGFFDGVDCFNTLAKLDLLDDFSVQVPYEDKAEHRYLTDDFITYYMENFAEGNDTPYAITAEAKDFTMVHTLNGKILPHNTVFDSRLFINTNPDGVVFHTNGNHWVSKAAVAPVTSAQGCEGVIMRSIKKRQGLLIYGSPGVGKTAIVRRSVPEERLYEVTYVEDEYPKDKILVFDDFANSQRRLEIFKTALGDFEDGRLEALSVIGLFNHEISTWKKMEIGDRDMILRRCDQVKVEYSNLFRAKCWNTKCADVIREKNFVERSKCLTVSVKWTGTQAHIEQLNKEYPSFSFVSLEHLLRSSFNSIKQEDYMPVYTPLVLPTPQFADYVVDIPRISTKISAKDFLAFNFWNSCNVIGRKETGSYEAASMGEISGVFMRVADVFADCRNDKAFNLSDFSRLFNSKERKLEGPFPHILLHFEDGTIGLMQDPDECTLFCYIVDDNAYQGDLHILNKGIMDGDRFISYDTEIQQRFLRAIRRYNNYVDVIKVKTPPPSITDENMFETFKRSEMGQWWVTGFTVLSLALSCGALIGLCCIDLGKSDEEDIVDDTQEERRSKRPKKKDPDADDYDHVQQEQPKKQVVPKINKESQEEEERKSKRPNKNMVPKDDDYDHDIKTEPAKRVLLKSLKPERKSKRPAKKVVEPTDDYDHDVKTEPKKIVEPKTQPEVRTVPQNKSIVLRDGEYGLLVDDEVYFLTEPAKGSFTAVKLPLTSDWKEVEHKFTKSRIDMLALSNSIGKDVHLNYKVQGEPSSVFAFMHYCGRPYDVSTDIDDFPLAQDIFKNFVVPDPGIDACQKEGIIGTNRNLALEGMIDPECRRLAMRILVKNQCAMYKDGIFLQHGMLIKNNLGIVNYHCPMPCRMKYQDKFYDVVSHSESPKNDVRIFKVTDITFSSVRSIMPHIITEADTAKYFSRRTKNVPIMLVVYDDGPLGRNTLLSPTYATMHYQTVASIGDGAQIRYKIALGQLGSTGVSIAGDCGSPILIMEPSIAAKFIGIHSRGAADISVAQYITREYVEQLCHGKYESLPFMARPNVDLNLFDESHICPTTKLEMIGVPKYKIFSPTATTERRIPLKLDPIHFPTIKSIKDPRNVKQRSLLKEGVARYGDPSPGKEDITNEVNYGFHCIADFLSVLFVRKEYNTRVLTNTEALNGTETWEFPASKDLDRSGSVGYPYVQQNACRSRKTDYLEQNKNNLQWYFRKDAASQQILARANLLVDDAKLGTANIDPWVAYLKDEVTKTKKCSEPDMKTRVFYSGSMSYLIAYRRLFTTAYWRIHETAHFHPVRVGIVARSLEWHLLYYRHAAVSTLGFASDMANWDGTVPIEFLRGVPIVANSIFMATDPNCTQEDCLARTTLHKNVEGATIIVGGAVYKLKQAMVSGCPGTAVENSLINWNLFYCVWRRLALINAPALVGFSHFMRLTCLSVYGDDNLCTVAPEVQPWFHFNSFKAEAAKFGFVVTDAAKTGVEVADLQPLETLEFLKRSFRKDGPWYLPALDIDSIMKVLCWIKEKPTYEFTGKWEYATDMEAVKQSLNAVWPELALHGKAKYDEVRNMVIRASIGSDVEIDTITYEDALAMTDFGM